MRKTATYILFLLFLFRIGLTELHAHENLHSENEAITELCELCEVIQTTSILKTDKINFDLILNLELIKFIPYYNTYLSDFETSIKGRSPPNIK
jgi:hypothetical protein